MEEIAVSPAPPVSAQHDQSELEHAYMWIRASIITGRYSQAAEALARFPRSLEFELNHAQLNATQLQNVPETLARLEALRPEFDKLSPYLRAELEATIGLLLAHGSRYRTAIRHYDRARELYAVAQLPRQAALITFNICVCASHLNLHALVAQNQAALRASASSENDPTIAAYCIRFDAYEALDREDFAAAREAFEQLRERFRQLGRRRDHDNALTYLAYIALKEERIADFDRISSQAEAYDVAWLRQRLELFKQVSEEGSLRAARAHEILRDAKRSAVDGRTLYLVCDLLLEGLIRSQDPAGALALSKKVGELFRKHDHVPDHIDLRYHAIRAHFALGLRSEAAMLLSQFEADARTKGSKARIEKARVLRETHSAPATQCAPSPSRRDQQCTVDLDSGTISRDGETIDLNGQGTIRRFLEILATHPHGIRYETLFQQCYDIPYHAIRHQARFHSLIARVRKCLGGSDALRWEDGILQLDPRILVQRSPGYKGARVRESRLKQICSILKTFRNGAPISRLEALYPGSRRALQLDIHFLVKNDRLVRIGKGRSTHYRIKEA